MSTIRAEKRFCRVVNIEDMSGDLVDVASFLHKVVQRRRRKFYGLTLR